MEPVGDGGISKPAAGRARSVRRMVAACCVLACISPLLLQEPLSNSGISNSAAGTSCLVVTCCTRVRACLCVCVRAGISPLLLTGACLCDGSTSNSATSHAHNVQPHRSADALAACSVEVDAVACDLASVEVDAVACDLASVGMHTVACDLASVGMDAVACDLASVRMDATACDLASVPSPISMPCALARVMNCSPIHPNTHKSRRTCKIMHTQAARSVDTHGSTRACEQKVRQKSQGPEMAGDWLDAQDRLGGSCGRTGTHMHMHTHMHAHTCTQSRANEHTFSHPHTQESPGTS